MHVVVPHRFRRREQTRACRWCVKCALPRAMFR